MLPRDFTTQEQLVAGYLTNVGLRYAQQYEIGKYIVDFFLPEIEIVLECDGVYGHFKKADRKRDKELLENGISKVIHIKQVSYINIEKFLNEELLNCQD